MTTSAPGSVGTRARASWWSRRADRTWDPRPWVPVLAVVAAAATHTAIAWGESFPLLPFDEITMVGSSRVIAGLPPWTLSDSGFMPGLAVLLAPVWWLTDDGVLVYRVGLWLTVLLGLLAIWPLSRIVVRTGVSTNAAVTAAAVVMMAPARALISNVMLAETLLLLCVSTAIVAADRAIRRPSVGRGVVAGLMIGAVVLAHGRGLAVAVAIGVWLLLSVRSARGAVLAAGVAALITSVAAFGLYRWVTAAQIARDGRIGNTFANPIDGSLVDTILEFIGQLWYAALAWPAVVMMALLWAVRRPRGGSIRLLLLLVTAASMVTTAIVIDPTVVDARPDAWFYGRYNDVVWTILAAVGVGLLVRVRWIVASLATVVGVAIIAVVMATTIGPRVPLTGSWVEVHIFGVSPWLSLERWVKGEPQQWALLGIVAVAFTALVCGLAWVGRIVVSVLAVAWMGLSVSYDRSILEIRDGERVAVADPFGLAALPSGTPIVIATQLTAERGVLNLTASAHDHPLVTAPIDALPKGSSVVLAPLLADEPRAAGAEVYADGPRFGTVLWVYPGEVFDALEAEGLLVDPFE